MNYIWTTTFRHLFDRCAALYRKGNTDYSAWFSSSDQAFLASIGCKPREFFDFIEDHCAYDDGPSYENALLVASARRDYFLAVQKGVPSSHVVKPDTLPAKSAAVDGIVWLPRLIVKARAKLRGEMDPDTMYGCGGDRQFFTTHDIDPADFLRTVWAAGDDDQKVIAFVKARGKWA